MSKRIIIILALVMSLILAGCSTEQVNVSESYIQENVLTECSTDTPLPLSTKGQDVYVALVEWQTVYNQCRITHHNLIEAVRQIQEQEQEQQTK